MNYRIIVLSIAVVWHSGCGRKNPVNEISVADSGIAISDPVPTRDMLDWNAWRGPTNNGVVPPQELVIEWDDQTNIRWRSEIPGRGHGSPIVVGSSVFVSTALDDKQQQCVICLDRKDGAETWRTIIHQGNFPSKNEIHKKGTNSNGTIACDGERLFTAMLNSDAIIATALDLQGETTDGNGRSVNSSRDSATLHHQFCISRW